MDLRRWRSWYWDEDRPEWDADDHDFAAAWRAQPRWVVSRRLKSPSLAASLTDLGLVDEYRLQALSNLIQGYPTVTVAPPRRSSAATVSSTGSKGGPQSDFAFLRVGSTVAPVALLRPECREGVCAASATRRQVHRGHSDRQQDQKGQREHGEIRRRGVVQQVPR